jgi:serine/threonine-protein kinase/endoribonuclease IRE1
VAGMIAFHILTKGGYAFGSKLDRLRHLRDGNPVGLDTLTDDVAKDLITWMLSHDPYDRPSAEEALKHPYLESAERQFEMLCKVGNEPEIKSGDVTSNVVMKLNVDGKDWQNEITPKVLKYLSTDFSKKKIFSYKPTRTDCLRFIRNVAQHWQERPRPRPEQFYIVGSPQEYFLKLFPNLPHEVHRIVRSCDWKERSDLKEYFI